MTWTGTAASQVLGERLGGAVAFRGAQGLAVPQKQRGDVGLAQARDVGEYGLVDRMQIARRAGDDAQDLAGGGLLL